MLLNNVGISLKFGSSDLAFKASLKTPRSNPSTGTVPNVMYSIFESDGSKCIPVLRGSVRFWHGYHSMPKQDPPNLIQLFSFHFVELVFLKQEQWLKSCLSWLVHAPVYMWLQLLLQCVVQVIASFGLHVNVCSSYMNKSCKGWYCRGQLGLGIIYVEQIPAGPLAPLANAVHSLTYNRLYVRVWHWKAIPSFSPATIFTFSKRWCFIINSA